ncbi:outer membrane protein assembly factor BamB [Rhodanobacter sp. Root179]|jgi:outer membrane protein assembly factor BamB|uniref:outer membrane protein assembly factor BamB n=1 Tax=unclassified Rhodanobacter TaxID=2621553 RepID=UPI0006FED78B|nr:MULTISPECIES: outer membrane protein assembly factor BamB [unclassified Rhodanobacter]KQZ77654.1 outer membrane protein assembly factor BamB [Rhodanobacter sp. Root561]KRB34785.1 outer membrane protein assembly factor BamB [Rhodanobacter sp. Root179]QRP65494.1 outer membrane protein assembly factor BamB [Rhodanobacter sp. FDAARGOS 1247]
MKRFLLITLASLATLAGCHSFKKENVQPPTPLAKDFKSTVQVTRLWKTTVGDGAQVSGVRLRPAVVDGVLYADSTDGKIAAIDATSGKTLWTKSSRTHGWFGWGDKKRKDAQYAGGPAVSGDLLAVGTLDGHVYAMSAKDGNPRWEVEVSGEVMASPVIVGDMVMVRTGDGRIYALDAADGHRRWVYDQSTVPLLSLRGNGTMLVANGVLFFGSDDGKLVALRQDNGSKLWEQRLSSGEGRTEIDKLNDADGSILLDGSTLYGAAYHGNLTAIDGPSGRPLWSHPFSTFDSLASNAGAIFGVDDQSQVWAFDRSTGTDMWKNASLKYRWVTGPAVQGNYVVVGDLEGYVHWLQSGDGALAARERLSKKAIRAQPLVVGDIVYVEDVEGHIGAYRLSSP